MYARCEIMPSLSTIRMKRATEGMETLVFLMRLSEIWITEYSFNAIMETFEKNLGLIFDFIVF